MLKTLLFNTHFQIYLRQDDKAWHWTSAERTVPASVWVTQSHSCYSTDIWAAKEHYCWGLAELCLTNNDIRTWTCHAEKLKSRAPNQSQALFGAKGLHLFTPPALMSKLNSSIWQRSNGKDGTFAKEVLAPVTKMSYTNMVSSHREHRTHTTSNTWDSFQLVKTILKTCLSQSFAIKKKQWAKQKQEENLFVKMI